MKKSKIGRGLKIMTKKFSVYTQIPGPEVERNEKSYLDFVKETIVLTEKHGYTGSLIYYNHYMADPWIVASYMLEHSNNIIPLVATQPNALPPHSVAKIIQSFHAIYNRKVNINLITGNNTREIDEINDIREHSFRYERMEEYASCLKQILALESNSKVNFNGKYYKYTNLYMEPQVNVEFLPEIFLAGASKEALNVSESFADVSLTRPGPIKEFTNKYKNSYGINKLGIRVGIIARERNEDAWEVAKSRFPKSRIGKIKAIAKSTNETIINNKEIATLAVNKEIYDDVYWMGAYLSNNNNPYLVGSFEEVSNYLNLYLKTGVNCILICDLYKEEDFEYTSEVIRRLEIKSNLLSV